MKLKTAKKLNQTAQNHNFKLPESKLAYIDGVHRFNDYYFKGKTMTENTEFLWDYTVEDLFEIFKSIGVNAMVELVDGMYYAYATEGVTFYQLEGKSDQPADALAELLIKIISNKVLWQK